MFRLVNLTLLSFILPIYALGGDAIQQYISELCSNAAENIERMDYTVFKTDVLIPNIWNVPTFQIESTQKQIEDILLQGESAFKQYLLDNWTKHCETITTMAPRALNQVILAANWGGYGCWCYYGSQSNHILSGRGPPVDTPDHFCKDLNEGYKCIMEEYLEETGTVCNPWDQQYSVNMGMVFQQGLGEAEGLCDIAAMGNNCIKKACLVEVYYAFRYFTYYMMYPSIDLNFKHTEALGPSLAGTFEPSATTCPMHVTGLVTYKYCCGEYPYRTRKVSNSAHVRCCGFTEFDNQTDQCCDDPYYFGWDGYLQSVNVAC